MTTPSGIVPTWSPAQRMPPSLPSGRMGHMVSGRDMQSAALPEGGYLSEQLELELFGGEALRLTAVRVMLEKWFPVARVGYPRCRAYVAVR